ncbi:Transcription factor teosinte branched 1 [Heracleum sosnowskyi]|uniref:Transcription factor teosinte branched 1 n=1 Tax=Heracleum sosnowskyi TaxID=360622 RepID=A0AAD8JJH4_9APIA|nr:Transcription factor teosinte branched 1 [Heracleum sosnowskyi]
MYPSDGYVNTAFTYNDFNPSGLGIQDLSSSSPFNLYEDEAIYSQHLHAILCATNYQGIVATNENSVTGNTENSSQIDVRLKEYMCAGGSSTDQPAARKKMGKKDRHSKINTAHGPRDRRMRLSLDVARKFFELQDVLGYDKASKTVEWLLKHSKGAIEEQFGGFPHMNKDFSIVTVSATSTSDDCDVVSGIAESIPRTSSSKTVLPSTCSKEKRTRSVRKPTFHPRTKESREKAREQARERTKEKRKQQLDVQQSASLMIWRPFGTGEEPVGTSHNSSNYNERLSAEVENMQNARKQHLQSQGIREESINISDPNIFFIPGNCSPSVLFNYQQTSGTFHEQYQFTDDY